ncbi:MAG: butyrate kinase [Eubacterium sp.]|nr:butyrate kinase [Candidatus Colimonas fimequi]
MAKTRSLIINPGSTSTKIAVFHETEVVFVKTLRHSAEELAQYDTIADQKGFRKDIIMEALQDNDIAIDKIDVCVGRGGFLKPIVGGTYEVTDDVYNDLLIGRTGQHASNLGGVLAREIADELGKKAYIVDPVVVDELMPIARVTGIPEIERRSIVHALNHKAVGKRYAESVGREYNELNLIICHLGGGVSVAAHQNGKMIEVPDALDGDGAFSPERTGRIPVGPLVELCFSGKYTKEEIKKMLVGKGGFVAHLGTNNMIEVDDRIEAGDEKAKFIMNAFVFQLAKDIGAAATALYGDVNQIIITGGIAYDPYVVEGLKQRCSWIAPITIYPGEDELKALTEGVLRVINGKEEPMNYNA